MCSLQVRHIFFLKFVKKFQPISLKICQFIATYFSSFQAIPRLVMVKSTSLLLLSMEIYKDA